MSGSPARSPAAEERGCLGGGGGVPAGPGVGTDDRRLAEGGERRGGRFQCGGIWVRRCGRRWWRKKWAARREKGRQREKEEKGCLVGVSRRSRRRSWKGRRLWVGGGRGDVLPAVDGGFAGGSGGGEGENGRPSRREKEEGERGREGLAGGFGEFPGDLAGGRMIGDLEGEEDDEGSCSPDFGVDPARGAAAAGLGSGG